MRTFPALVLLMFCNLAWSQAQQAPAPSSIESPDASNSNPLPTTSKKSYYPGIPAVPQGKAALIGGIITGLDELRDEIAIQPFGGSPIRVLFDERTHVFADGKAGSLHDLRRGQHIYAETVLDQAAVFARTIHIASRSFGQSSGEIVSYAPETRELVLQDVLLASPITLHLDANAMVLHAGRSVSLVELRRGALVAVSFSSSATSEPVASKISILADPGEVFTFSGPLIHLDLHTRLLVLTDANNGRTYEIACDPALISPDLREGMNVTVTANYNGVRYSATSVARTLPPK